MLKNKWVFVLFLFSFSTYSQLHISQGTVIFIKDGGQIFESSYEKDTVYSSDITANSESRAISASDIYVKANQEVIHLPKKNKEVSVQSIKKEFETVKNVEIDNTQLFSCDTSSSVIDCLGDAYISGIVINTYKINIFLQNVFNIQVLNVLTSHKEHYLIYSLWCNNDKSSIKFTRPPPSQLFI